MLAVLLILNLIFFGLQATYFFRLKFFLEERLIIGLLLGIISLGYIWLFLAHFFGLNVYSLIIFLGVINIINILVFSKKILLEIKEDIKDFRLRFSLFRWKVFFLILFIFIVILSFLASQLFISYNNRFFVQPVHAYGDISLHLGIISSFAFGNNFPPQSPIFSGGKVSYPFLFDFITAIFVNPLGLTLDQAVALTGILGMILVIFSLAYFALHLTKNMLSSVLFLILFFFSGGLGFIYFFRDLFSGNFIWIKDYTAMKDIGFYWINVVLMMLLPQRSFLLGLPLSLLIIRLFWEILEAFIFRKFVLAIILTSLLPIIHGHSLVAIAPILGWLTLIIINKNRSKLFYILLVGLTGLIVAYLLSRLFFEQIDNPLQFIKVQIGWMAGNESLVIFYLKNFGLILFILPITLWVGLKKRLNFAYLALIGQIWFILPSLFIFQPWDFDNTKLFIYWYILSILLVAYFISRLLLRGQFTSIITGFLIMISLTLSGQIDIMRLLLSSSTRYEVYSPQAIKMAEFIKYNTSKTAVFLAVDKFDNPAVSLAGRKTVLGFHGWLWTYGINYSGRERDVRWMLAGQAEDEVFKKYKVTHTILFNEESGYTINEEYFNRYRLIYNQDGYRIYEI